MSGVGREAYCVNTSSDEKFIFPEVRSYQDPIFSSRPASCSRLLHPFIRQNGYSPAKSPHASGALNASEVPPPGRPSPGEGFITLTSSCLARKLGGLVFRRKHHTNMASHRPTIQSLMSASYDETDESGDGSSGDHHHTLPSFHSRFVDPQKLTAIPAPRPPQQVTGTARETKTVEARNRMNDEMRDGGGTGGENEAGNQANKGPKRGARACTNCKSRACLHMKKS